MVLPIDIETKLTDLYELCKKHQVSKLFVFGSVSKGTFNPKTSDLDLIVELNNLPPVEKGETLIKF